MKKGNLSINSENILPIIKKWLYSDSDIFIRELVSNGCDAINKLKKLSTMGEANISDENFNIKVVLDKENSTIQIIDNGIGMTADEIEEYITQIAFSGASDFVNKYKDQLEDGGDIIGHFGLGFYSAFMVADKVMIDTLSYKDGATPAKWICDGGIEYEIGESDRTERGTTITLFVGEEGKDFLNAFKLREILNKYCYFMPIEIFFEDLEQIKKDAEKENENDTIDENEIKEIKEPLPINKTNPLWLKQPNECTDEEYKEFYHQVFSDFNEPLFWIHLNMDYPFKLKGILYFPKLKHELDSIEGQVKLYNNQVFIADNLKEVIPEFLLLLKGTLDCPDLPLNVSRSFLQNDGYVTKMSKYITKKVADKLNSLFKKQREDFEGFWDDISQFIKYGCLREKDFYDKVKDSLLFKTINNKYVTLNEYLEQNKEHHENKVFYVTDENQQAQYIKMFKDNNMDAVILNTKLDNPYMSTLEMYNQGTSFVRIDSDLSDTLKDSSQEENKELNEALETLFKDTLNKGDNLKIKVENLKATDISGVIQLSEQARRMEEMAKMYGMNMPFGAMPSDETLILNGNNNVVKLLLKIKDDNNKKEETNLICNQIYDLATMSHKHLDMNSMTNFIERSNKILEILLNNSL
ncbi:molecular chaperone HtpG [uncultured Tyzzerella sp.]|uniref:molecular chaperone HtpG n=1 Tax=uncultured Tyzzerella sp. TaxID=2321398 RepID=UPI002942C6BC|nr:molecular chaperone HtpG [uncultured Tyzzerella sp.]